MNTFVRRGGFLMVVLLVALAGSCRLRQSAGVLLVISQTPATWPTDLAIFQQTTESVTKGIQQNAASVGKIAFVPANTKGSLWRTQAVTFDLPAGVDCEVLPPEEVKKLGIKRLFKTAYDKALNAYQTQCMTEQKNRTGSFAALDRQLNLFKSRLSATSKDPTPCFNYQELLGRLTSENAKYNLLILNGVAENGCLGAQAAGPFTPRQGVRLVVILLPTANKNADYAARFERLRKVFPTASILPATLSADAIDVLYGRKEPTPFNAGQ